MASRILFRSTFRVFLTMFSFLVLLSWPIYSVLNSGHTWGNQSALVNWWSMAIAPSVVGFMGIWMMSRIPASRRFRLVAALTSIAATLLLVMLLVYPLTQSYDTARHSENLRRELRPVLEQGGAVDIDAALDDVSAFSPFGEFVTFVGTIRGYLVSQFLWGCLAGALVSWLWKRSAYGIVRGSEGVTHLVDREHRQ